MDAQKMYISVRYQSFKTFLLHSIEPNSRESKGNESRICRVFNFHNIEFPLKNLINGFGTR
jgi:hypothetical protein